jgi:hypothetical protein
MTQLPARLLLDLGGVKQGGDDGRRANAHGYAGLHQLGAALVAGMVGRIAIVGDGQLSLAADGALEAA